MYILIQVRRRVLFFLSAILAFAFVLNALSAAESIPAPGSKLSPVEANATITAADLTAERVGSSIPVSAIGEPVSAVNLSQPRWVENANGGYGVVDGAIMPVDPKSKPINFRVILPASWSRRGATWGWRHERVDPEPHGA